MDEQKIAPVLSDDEMRQIFSDHAIAFYSYFIPFVRAIEQAVLARVGAVPLADCWSDNEGDSWRDSPEDCDFLDGLKVGDEYELQASIRSWPERFRVTKAPDGVSDDYEVEPVDIALKGTPTAAVANAQPVGVTFLVHSKNHDKTQCNFMRKDVPEGTKLYTAPQSSGNPGPLAAVERDAELPPWWSAFVQNVCELPDRNTPDGEPEAMIVTVEELENAALVAIASSKEGAAS